MAFDEGWRGVHLAALHGSELVRAGSDEERHLVDREARALSRGEEGLLERHL